METLENLSLLTTVLEVTELLEQAEIEYFIGGSLASSLWGQERTTHDADIAALIAEPQLEVLERLIEWPYILDSADLRKSLSSTADFASGQILNGETLDKIDLFLLMEDDFAHAQLRNRRYVEVVPGRSLPFAAPEDIVITKLRWFVLGNRISDRQWNDIVQVLEMQHGMLDDGYMARWAEHFQLSDLLTEAERQVVTDG